MIARSALYPSRHPYVVLAVLIGLYAAVFALGQAVMFFDHASSGAITATLSAEVALIAALSVVKIWRHEREMLIAVTRQTSWLSELYQDALRDIPSAAAITWKPPLASVLSYASTINRRRRRSPDEVDFDNELRRSLDQLRREPSTSETETALLEAVLRFFREVNSDAETTADVILTDTSELGEELRNRRAVLYLPHTETLGFAWTESGDVIRFQMPEPMSARHQTPT